MQYSLVLSILAATALAMPSYQYRRATNGGGKISESATKLIESEEGWSATFYKIGGDETIGYGYDCTQQGDCSSIHSPISKAEGETLLKKELTSFEKCVCGMKNADDLNMSQFGALVSFAYNSGCGGVEKYFDSYMDKKDFTGICKALPTTNTLGGELSGRRKREAEFCNEKSSEKSGCK